MHAQGVTRGHGLLEGFLAGQRRRQAERLIPERLRAGRILDIGCGSFPVFLLNTRFAERYGLDRLAPPDAGVGGITLLQHDVADGSRLPFDDAFFDVVTMLAVFEHIEVAALKQALREIHRVLRPSGLYVMTTPARWTEGLLSAMARVGLVSHEEVGEHKGTYTRTEIASMLARSGFATSRIRHGVFEAGMNQWAVAEKDA